jgi:hypothetical protein
MPKAMLTAMTVLACLVVILGCRDRPVDDPDVAQEAIRRSTTIWTPEVAPSKPQRTPSVRPESEAPEPAMSTPPPEATPDPPAAAPPAQHTPRRRAPSNYTDGCGRPLVA